MKLLVIGASGRTGRLIVEEGLARGHEMVALVRDATSFEERRHLTVAMGTPLKESDLLSAIGGCDAVLSALNNQRVSEFPWAKPKSPTHLLRDAARNTLMAMEAVAVKRLVILSAAGTAESFEAAPWILRFLVRNSNLGIAYADHDAVDALMRRTTIDWTLVRAVGLSNKDSGNPLLVSNGQAPKPGMFVSRQAVARFMIDCVENRGHLRGTPVISQK